MSGRRRIRSTGGGGGGTEIIYVEVPVDSQEITTDKWQLNIREFVRSKANIVGIAARAIENFRASVTDALVVIAWIFENANLRSTATIKAIAVTTSTFTTTVRSIIAARSLDPLRTITETFIGTYVRETAELDESSTIYAIAESPDTATFTIQLASAAIVNDTYTDTDLISLLLDTDTAPGISPNAHTTSTGMTNPANAYDGAVTSPGATSAVSSSGIGQTTSNSITQEFITQFQDYDSDVNYITDITRVELFVRFAYVRSGSGVSPTGPYPSRDIDFYHNLSGSFVSWYNSTDTGVLGSADVALPATTVSVDVTSDVNDDWSKIDDLQWRMTGEHSSGAGTVTQTTLTLQIHEVWIEIEAERLSF